uniref:Ovule protein n=1 Tax=Steinernema glaseri TaxID=37863 RepID=A0A1I8AK13_9BILA
MEGALWLMYDRYHEKTEFSDTEMEKCLQGSSMLRFKVSGNKTDLTNGEVKGPLSMWKSLAQGLIPSSHILCYDL